MPATIHDLHVAAEMPLPTPAQLRAALPISDAAATFITQARASTRAILRGLDDRLLVIVGPCSIHEPASAREFAARLRELIPAVEDALQLVMRVYFEKPRTRMGWKGLIYDPGLDGQGDMEAGLHQARQLLLTCAELGVPAASEILDLVTPQYYAELLTWGAIGARTVESPLHRQMASALSAPVGFKNATNGSVSTAIDAIHVAAQSHRFPSISLEGKAIVITTTGNPDGHLVLRGASDGPNFSRTHVASAAAALTAAGLPARLAIDCSHGNSNKDHTRQRIVATDISQQIADGSEHICAVMLESHLVAGRQEIVNGCAGLRYGQSVTDACLGWDETTPIFHELAAAVRQRRQLAADRAVRSGL